MATTASGVTIPGSSPTTTAATPIQDHWNNLGKSLTGRLIVPVASVTARATLVVALAAEGFVPSPATPLYTHRADATAGSGLEVTVNGTTWTAVNLTGSNMGTPTSTATAGTASTGTTETRDAVLGNHVFTAVAGRRYQVRLDGMALYCNTLNDRFICNLRDGGASTPTAASPGIVGAIVNAAIITSWACPIAASVSVFSTGTHTLSMFTQRTYGTGVGQPVNARELYVVDLGPA